MPRLRLIATVLAVLAFSCRGHAGLCDTNKVSGYDKLCSKASDDNVCEVFMKYSKAGVDNCQESVFL